MGELFTDRVVRVGLWRRSILGKKMNDESVRRAGGGVFQARGE